MYKTSLFFFRRDLRLDDNLGLINCLQQSQQVIPCFVLNPCQTKSNPFKGQAALNFMFESLRDLHLELNAKNSGLKIFVGNPSEILKKIHTQIRLDAVFINQEYTPFGLKRDLEIERTCNSWGISFHQLHDCLLNSPENIIKKDHSPYKKFTPYLRASKKINVPIPQKNNFSNYFTANLKSTTSLDEVGTILNYKKNPLSITGGRINGQKILNHLETYKNYSSDRDMPFLDSTTHLSPHHKFGTISPRETYHAIKERLSLSHPLISQLYWRDFFTYIGYFFPHVLGKCFYEKYERIKWENNEHFFQLFCQGKTGFPIVDAGMRELNQSGFMHNRVRMIVASFLTKDLNIDWRKGEMYFAQHLSDYDPLVNNGNWQWAAGCGCDSVPYFRIFNPWLQQKKFDKDCLYIKKWVPELRGLDPKDIHALEKKSFKDLNYPHPIVDHHKRKLKTLKIFRKLSG